MFGRNVPVKKEINFDLTRKAAAHKTYEAWVNVPHAGIVVELNVTKVLELVRLLRSTPEFSDVKLTINLAMLKIMAAAFKASPELNSYCYYNKKTSVGTIKILDDVNIGMNMLLPDGRTITPVLQKVDKLSLKDLCLEMKDLLRRIKNTNIDMLYYFASRQDTIEQLKKGKLSVIPRIFKNLFGKHKIQKPTVDEQNEYAKIPDKDKLTVENLLSATVLISNIGSALRNLPSHISFIGVVPPQMTVFGMAGIQRKPVVVRDENKEESIKIQDVLPCTMYMDHRGMDFGAGIPFLRKLLDFCEHPEKILS